MTEYGFRKIENLLCIRDRDWYQSQKTSASSSLVLVYSTLLGIHSRIIDLCDEIICYFALFNVQC